MTASQVGSTPWFPAMSPAAKSSQTGSSMSSPVPSVPVHGNSWHFAPVFMVAPDIASDDSGVSIIPQPPPPPPPSPTPADPHARPLFLHPTGSYDYPCSETCTILMERSQVLSLLSSSAIAAQCPRQAAPHYETLQCFGTHLARTLVVLLNLMLHLSPPCLLFTLAAFTVRKPMLSLQSSQISTAGHGACVQSLPTCYWYPSQPLSPLFLPLITSAAFNAHDPHARALYFRCLWPAVASRSEIWRFDQYQQYTCYSTTEFLSPHAAADKMILVARPL